MTAVVGVFATAVLTTAWMAASSHVGPSIRLALLVAATVAFTIALLRSADVSPRTVFIASAIVLSSATLLTPRDSGDVYMYGMFGSIAGNHGDSPYVHTPQEYPDDPLLQPTTEQWRHVRSPYGPLFTVFSAGIAKVAAGTPMLAVRIFQGLDALVVFGIAVALYRRTKDVRTAAFIGLNPALVTMVNGGHNDIITAGFLVAALLCGRNQAVLTGLLLACAVCIKITAALPVAAFILWLLLKDRDRRALTIAVTTTVAFAAYALPGITNVAGSLGDSGMVTSRASLWSLPHHLLGKPGMYACIVLVALALCATCVKRMRIESAVLLMAFVAIAEVFLYPYVLPWYAAPAIALAALANNHRVMLVAQVQAMALVFVYVVPPGEPAGGVFAALSACAFPLAALAAVLVIQKQLARRLLLEASRYRRHAPG